MVLCSLISSQLSSEKSPVVGSGEEKDVAESEGPEANEK
jgi:hypothetical protein